MAVLAAGAVQPAGRASDAAASVEESALPRGRAVAEQVDPADIIRKRRKPTMSNVDTVQVSVNVHQKERIPVSHLPGQLALARVPQPEHRRHVEVIPHRDIEPQRIIPEDRELPASESAFGSEEEE